jgi:hypothetical protein
MSAFYYVTVKDKKDKSVEVDPDDVLEELSETEIIGYLETHHGYDGISLDDHESEVATAVAVAISDLMGTAPTYDQVADAFWHGDFDFEKLFPLLGKDGMRKLREMVMKSDL